MARFSIEMPDKNGEAFLTDGWRPNERRMCLTRAHADEIRRLLDEAFPPDLVCEECGDPVVPMKNKPGLYKHSCPVQTAQPPAQVDPDPDEVRRFCDDMEPHWQAEPARLSILAAARAWLRMREQQPEPGPKVVPADPSPNVCADCRYVRKPFLPWSRSLYWKWMCGHPYARAVITGEPTSCFMQRGSSPRCEGFAKLGVE